MDKEDNVHVFHNMRENNECRDTHLLIIKTECLHTVKPQITEYNIKMLN